MTRSIVNFRPKGDADAPVYAPQRDLVNIYLPMLKEVFTGLDEVNWAAYFSDWLAATKVTEGDLGEGVRRFVHAHQLFIRERTINSPYDAFERAGFWELPAPVRILIFERIGEVVMGGFFVALRDASYQGRSSAVHTDFMDMLAAGRVLATMLSKHQPRELAGDLLQTERANVELIEFQRMYKQLMDENESICQERGQYASERDGWKARATIAEPAHAWVLSLSVSFWRRIIPCLRLMWWGKLPQSQREYDNREHAE